MSSAEETFTELQQWLKEIEEACEFSEGFTQRTGVALNEEKWMPREWAAARKSYQSVLDLLETKRSGNG